MVARNMQSHWQNADVQNAKALAILEVKDVVIASLEEELKKAEVEVEHYEEIAEQTKARAAMAESTQIQATRSELATLKDGGGNFTDSDCEALSEMAMQAERRTQEAENDVVKLQAESQEAEQRVEHLTKQLAAKQLELPGRQFKVELEDAADTLRQKLQLCQGELSAGREESRGSSLFGIPTVTKVPDQSVLFKHPKFRDEDLQWLKDELARDEQELLSNSREWCDDLIGERLRLQDAQAACHVLEQEVGQERLMLKEARSRHKSIEQWSRARVALTHAVASIEASTQRLECTNKKDVYGHELERGREGKNEQELESYLQKARHARNSLYTLCRRVQEGSTQVDTAEMWQQGASEMAGKILLLSAALRELDVQIHMEEMAMQHIQPEQSKIMCELQEVDAQAKAELTEARTAAAALKFQEASSKQSGLLQEIAQEKIFLRQNQAQNKLLADTREQVAKALSIARKRQQNLVEEEFNSDMASEISLLRQTLLDKAGLSRGSVQQILGTALEAVARAHCFALSSDMKLSTWKSLANHLEVALPVPGAIPMPSYHSEIGVFPSPEHPGSQHRWQALETQISALTEELHRTMADCKRHQLESHAFEARYAEDLKFVEERSATEARKELDQWRKELFKTCGTWLPPLVQDWHTAAVCRERGFEHEVQDLLSKKQIVQESLTILAAQHQHLRKSAGCAELGIAHGDPRHGREQVLQLKSQLATVQEELHLAKTRSEVQRSRRRSKDGEFNKVSAKGLELEDICPSLTSIAQELEQMVATRQSESGELVLQELAKTKAWCEELRAQLRKDSSRNQVDYQDFGLASLHPGTFVSSNASDLPVNKDSRRSSEIMNRVEAIFQAQRELHMGYRAVLKEIHDLQLKRQAQEAEAEALQEQKVQEAEQEAEAERRSEIGHAELLQLQHRHWEELQTSRRWRGLAEEERAREFEMEEVAAAHELAEAKAQQETRSFLRSCELAQEQKSKADNTPLTARHLQLLSESLQEDSISVVEREGLIKLGSSIAAVNQRLSEEVQMRQEFELELERARLEHAQAESECSKSQEKTQELQEQVQGLMLASSAACEMRNAEANLSKREGELESTSSQLHSQRLKCQEWSSARDTQLEEVKMESMKMEELQYRARQLELQMQRAEAKIHTQDRHFRQERQEWYSRLRQLQLADLPRRKHGSPSEPGSPHAEMKALAAQREETEMLLCEKARLEEEAADIKLKLESAKEEMQVMQKQEYAESRRRGMLLHEITCERNHTTALVQEIERLRDATVKKEVQADEPVKAKEVISQAKVQRPTGTEQSRTKHVQRLLAQEEKQEGLLKEQIETSMRTADDLRERMRDAEQRLAVSRDDVERKKALVSTLQRRTQESSQQFNADSQLEDELSRTLQQMRRDISRKDAALKHLRADVLEARRLDEKSEQTTPDTSNTAEAAANAKLKAELRRKERALHQAEGKMQLLKARLAAEEQMAAQAAQANARRSRLVGKGPRPVGASLTSELEPLEPLEPSAVSEGFQDESRSSGVAALEQELSGILLRAGNSIESSWEQSAVRESLEILNLQIEDLPEFLAHGSDLTADAKDQVAGGSSPSSLRVFLAINIVQYHQIGYESFQAASCH
ncbi:unnamed protein product [Durusdinium trenchii]|uniref:Uncharacterized protein n=1 Tax=Durusdinium trenchii TaxID=1381693 RepID=A0ABP0PER1_9DINO